MANTRVTLGIEHENKPNLDYKKLIWLPQILFDNCLKTTVEM